MINIYKNIEEYNPNKKQNILIVFDDMIADMPINKKLNQIVTDLFIRGKKLNISLVFILFGCSKKYQTKLNILFCNENSKQNRTSKKLCLTIQQVLTFKTL